MEASACVVTVHIRIFPRQQINSIALERYGEVDLSPRSHPSLSLFVVFSLTLIFVLHKFFHLLPLPSHHPWWQGCGILGSKQCLLNSVHIHVQVNPSRVCSVLKIPPSTFFLLFAALLLYPVLFCPHPTLYCSLLHRRGWRIRRGWWKVHKWKRYSHMSCKH